MTATGNRDNKDILSISRLQTNVRTSSRYHSRSGWISRVNNCFGSAFEQATGRALPRQRRRLPPPQRRRRRSHPGRQVSPSTLLCWLTWGLRSWACSCSTGGGRTMAGSAAPSPVSARAARSRTWWLTRARRRRCAAQQTHCLTPPPTVTVPGGCCSFLPLPPASWPHWPGLRPLPRPRP
jgi:hypothetical protein